MDCVHGYFASRGACWPCNDSGAAMKWRVGAAVVVGIGAFVVIAAAFTLWYRTVADAPVGFAGAEITHFAASSVCLVVSVCIFLLLQQNTYWCACHVFPEVGFSWKQSRTLRSCCRPASFGRCCQHFPHLKVLNAVNACAALLTGKWSSQNFTS